MLHLLGIIFLAVCIFGWTANLLEWLGDVIDRIEDRIRGK